MLRALITTSPPTPTAHRPRPRCSAATCIPPPLTIDATRGGRRSSSLYEVLRVKHNATTTEIKAAYRSLAKVYHPDALRLGTEAGMSRCGREFMEIHDAYETLTDPAARAVYDLTLGLGGGRRRQQSSEYEDGRGGRTTRRWETDQCW
ncbi:hypothetical protein MLD38_035086 [Melastoma candidum]|uniref:Uncharacterized protein n=1 Tax=Melastoma candidum TaxID=119954 RepID=A0ACB9MCI5_9MYRT|nr:hypothetical protein MLD38_035086 [Melastoma candidum]